MHRYLFLIVCILILTACQPPAAPIPTETAAPVAMLPAATATLVVPTITPTPEPSPTLKPPAKPVELKPVLITEAGKGFDFTAVASQYPELDSALQKALTEKLQLAKNSAPDHQKSISIAVSTDENGVKTLWFQAGLQPLIALDKSALIIPPSDLIVRVGEIDQFVPLGWPTYPLAAGTSAETPPVPRFIKTYTSVTENGENRILAYDSADQIIAYWKTSDDKGLWTDIATNQPLLVYLNKNGANFGEWEQPLLPEKDGKPDFTFNPKRWFTVPEGQATAENHKQWIAYYLDWAKATYPDPTGEVKNLHFGWGQKPDGSLRWMALPYDAENNLPLANEVLPGMTFENALTDLETGKKVDLHIFPLRILQNSGKFGLVPVAVSDWEFQIMVQANKQAKFSKKAGLSSLAPSIEFVASGDLSLSKISGANADNVKTIRALLAAGWINNQNLDTARDWIETHFSVDGYKGLKYNPDVLPPDLTFVVGGIVVYTRY